MTQKYKLKKIALVIIGLVFLAAGCGGGGGPVNNGPIILTVWKTFEDSQNLQPLFDMYTQKHPNVQIVYSKKNYETYEQDLLNALASGQGPDIFSIHNDWLPKFLDKTTPAPEKTFSLRDYKTNFVDVVVEDFTHQDKIYGTALAVDSLGLYYNKDILGSVGIATPPKTWGELSSQVQRIKKADGRGYFTTSGVAMGNTSNINRAVDILYLLMLQKRVQAYTPDKQRPSFADSFQDKNNNYTNPGLTALTFYTSFANPSSINYNWNARSDYSVDAFTNGRAAFMFSYAYMAQTIKLKNANLNFDVAPVPQPSLEETSVNFSNYWGEVVSKQSKNQEAAWEFLKFITSKEALDSYYAQNKQPSSRKDLIELQIQDPQIGVFAHANLTAKAFYKPDQEKIDSIFGKMIDNVILSGFSEEDALSQAQAQAATLINR